VPINGCRFEPPTLNRLNRGPSHRLFEGFIFILAVAADPQGWRPELLLFEIVPWS
jgi:hypothetical protein